MKINKILVIASAVIYSLLLTSCEEQENISLEIGDGFVQFAQTSGSVAENSADPLVATVLFGGNSEDNPNGITVNFEVISDDSSRFQVSPAGGSISIPAGEVSADIIITPVDNFLVDGNLDVKIKLLDSSSVPVGIGGENVNFNEIDLSIVDNDCPIDINAFVGTYSVFENFTAGVNSPRGLSSFFGESYQLEMALDPNDASGTQLIITNSIGFDTYIVNGTVLKFDTCNNAVTFNGQSRVQVALFRTFVYTNSTYSEDDLVIKATGPLSTFGDYQFTFTKL